MTNAEDLRIALFSMCIDLAPDADALVDWGRAHGPLIDAQPDHIFHPVKTLFAGKRAELNRSDR